MSVELQNLSEESVESIKKRRTFAIISHPDAGKTTLTEKLLLYGGAIREAGAVKSRKAQRAATSDWMEMEKQRGISISSSVMQFQYEDFFINILDTPGHQDFSEDTYRTLMAADSALMVIDHGKGVQEQTQKLFQVCKMRKIPIFTFINKMDRVGRDNFEILEEIENLLKIKTYPINWPIGEGKDFKGVFDRKSNKIIKFDGSEHGSKKAQIESCNLDDPNLDERIGTNNAKKLREDIELLDIAGDDFDIHAVEVGDLTPVFFGSALTNFGVEPFLKEFLELSSPPISHHSSIGDIDACADFFSGFVFKIQANMNAAHRDRIAFLRICSGRFDANMQVTHVQQSRKVKLSQPTQFMAQSREIIERAYAGDIVGIHDTQGVYQIGDTLTNHSVIFEFDKIPAFQPEHFARVYTKNSLKRKQFIKGMEQLSHEGTIQIFKKLHFGTEELIAGVVGVLQFDVLKYRLESEYGVDIIIEPMDYRYIRWIDVDAMGGFDPDSFSKPLDTLLVETYLGHYAVLMRSEWSLKHIIDRNKGIILKEID